MSEFKAQKRNLGLFDSAALVVGPIIGTGVFLKASVMASEVQSSLWVLAAWVLAGLLSFAGALTYAELGALFPHAGGEYVYLREAYGDVPAFLYGWQRFWISNPATIAAYAVGAATFAAPLFHLEDTGSLKAAALGLVALFTLLNCLAVSIGSRVQSIMTVIKVGIILFIIVGLFFFSDTASVENLKSSAHTHWPGWSAFGSATLAALWAYDGWNNLPMVGGEIRNPQKNIPLSLGLGVLMVVLLYSLIHLGYFFALPLSEVISANSKHFPEALPVATKAANTFLGQAGVLVLTGAFVFSALGAMNGSILTCSRVPYAMAQDGLFIKSLAKLHKRTETPVISLVVQGFLAGIMSLLGNFDQLTDYVVFASWIFYAMVTFSVIRLRKTHPQLERHYKTMGYPVVPLLFVGLAGLLIFNTIFTMPNESLVGLGIMALGVPVYFLFQHRRKKERLSSMP